MTALRTSLFGLFTGPSTGSGGFARHYTGVLTPRGSKGVDSYIRIAAPAAPSLSQVAGGSLAAATLFAKATLVSPSGETAASSESSLAVSANNLLRIAAPASAGNATGWNAYVAGASGAETLQNATPIALGTNWTEPTSGLVTGTATPPAANTTGWDVFNLFVPDPVASASFIADPVDTGFNAELRVFLTASFGLGFGQSGSPAIGYAIDTWLGGQADPGSFTAWPSVGYVVMRYLRARLSYTPVQGALAYIGDFVPTIDTAPTVETGNSLTVGAGGTTITFPAQFHAPPQVIATCISSASLVASVASVTATGCTFHVWNSSGVDVGGVINYEAIGE
ncbi:MAG TPA: hypothetical protein VG328_05070 [Stellaceae bacterium]|jgi:hypothetical protein|nr:hypothetical protein [Stellaceae bacterium]